MYKEYKGKGGGGDSTGGTSPGGKGMSKILASVRGTPLISPSTENSVEQPPVHSF